MSDFWKRILRSQTTEQKQQPTDERLKELQAEISAAESLRKHSEHYAYQYRNEEKRKRLEYETLLHEKYSDLKAIKEIITTFQAKYNLLKEERRQRNFHENIVNLKCIKEEEYLCTIQCLEDLYKETLANHNKLPPLE